VSGAPAHLTTQWSIWWDFRALVPDFSIWSLLRNGESDESSRMFFVSGGRIASECWLTEQVQLSPRPLLDSIEITLAILRELNDFQSQGFSRTISARRLRVHAPLRNELGPRTIEGATHQIGSF
jgi:hypothetical protein